MTDCSPYYVHWMPLIFYSNNDRTPAGFKGSIFASMFHRNEMTAKRLNPIRKVEHGFRECPLKDLQHSEQTSSVRTLGFLNVNMALKPGRVLSGTAARSILHWTPPPYP